MRGLVASVFLAAAVLPALADDSSNTRQVPIALFFKGPSSYPPDAAAKGEEGFVVIAIVPTPDNRLPRAKLVESSGYSDLDAASLELALPYYRSGQMVAQGKRPSRPRAARPQIAPRRKSQAIGFSSNNCATMAESR